ncbi:MAG: ElyC/SanA/YdcF family protein [Aquihabitans sp.]
MADIDQRRTGEPENEADEPVGAAPTHDQGRTAQIVRHVRAHPLRSALRLMGAALVLLVLMTALAVGWVRWTARGHVYDVADVPPAPVAIVLGAGLRPDGTPSTYLQARLDDAASLYRTDKVQAILVTGDHGQVEYDEVAAMSRWLVDHGVPARHVVADHAGFDTYDSCQRARRIFGIDQAIVVTQGFHVPRAVFLCRQAGISTDGVASAAQGGRPGMNQLREIPASLKAALDAIIDPGPRYLGPEETGVDDALSG